METTSRSAFRRENLFPDSHTILYAECSLIPPEPLGFRLLSSALALFHPEAGVKILALNAAGLKEALALQPDILEDYPQGHLYRTWEGKLLPGFRAGAIKLKDDPVRMLDAERALDCLKAACPASLPWRWARPFALVTPRSETPEATLRALAARHWPAALTSLDLTELM